MAALTDAGWTVAHEVCESPAGVGGVYGCAALRAGQSDTERSERRHCAGCEAARATLERRRSVLAVVSSDLFCLVQEAQ